MFKRVNRAYLVIGKVAVTALIIAAIGAVMVVGADGEVSDSQADITALDFGPRPKVERFGAALQALGHPQPRVYELNGNRIFFSVNHMQEQPEQILRRYQDEFVRQGLNAEPFYDTRISKALPRSRASFTGGVVPMSMASNLITMGGVELRSRHEKPLDIFQAFDPNDGPAELFDAYRWVEIRRQEDSTESTIVASWSDEGFDYEKMFPEAWGRPGKGVDSRIPICAGCERISQLGERAREGTHETYLFLSDSTSEQLQTFYRHTLAERGWSLSENYFFFEQFKESVVVEDSEMVRLEFRRDDLLLEIMIYPFDQRQMGVRTVLVDNEHLRSSIQH